MLPFLACLRIGTYSQTLSTTGLLQPSDTLNWHRQIGPQLSCSRCCAERLCTFALQFPSWARWLYFLKGVSFSRHYFENYSLLETEELAAHNSVLALVCFYFSDSFFVLFKFNFIYTVSVYSHWVAACLLLLVAVGALYLKFSSQSW